MGLGSVMQEIILWNATLPRPLIQAFHGNDLLTDLIVFWQDLIDGTFDPSDYKDIIIDEGLYDAWRAQRQRSGEKTFVGFVCSYAGQFYQGFQAKHQGSLKKAIARLMKARDIMGQVTLSNVSYELVRLLQKAVIYMDAPYENTTGYGTHYHKQRRNRDANSYALVQPFDTQAMWRQACEWTNQGHLVFVSESSLPPSDCDFIVFSSWPFKNRTEYLFVHRKYQHIVRAVHHDLMQPRPLRQLTVPTRGLKKRARGPDDDELTSSNGADPRAKLVHSLLQRFPLDQNTLSATTLYGVLCILSNQLTPLTQWAIEAYVEHYPQHYSARVAALLEQRGLVIGGRKRVRFDTE